MQHGGLATTARQVSPSFIRTVPSAPEFHRIMQAQFTLIKQRSCNLLVGFTTGRELRSSIIQFDKYAHPAPKVLLICQPYYIPRDAKNQLNLTVKPGTELIRAAQVFPAQPVNLTLDFPCGSAPPRLAGIHPGWIKPLRLRHSTIIQSAVHIVFR